MGKGKAAAPAKPTTKFGVVSKPLFHSEVKHFADGGEASEPQINEPVYADPLGAKISQIQDQRAVEKASEKPAEKTDYSDSETFGKAFAAARSAGRNTFTFNGKSYTTQMADNKPKQPKQPAQRDAEADDAMRNYDRVANLRDDSADDVMRNYDRTDPPAERPATSTADRTYSVTPDGRIRRTGNPKPKAEPAPKTGRPSLMEALREGMRTTRK